MSQWAVHFKNQIEKQMLIEKVTSDSQITIIAELAEIIWNEYFTPIIGKAQVDYMLDKFQSKKSISEQLKQGYQYFLFRDKNYIGYTGVLFKADELFLSKLYILSSRRNQGYGRSAIEFLEQLGLDNGLHKITLTVNKYNSDTITAYEKLGFINTGAVVQNIGNNFVMDDFKMEKLF